MFSLVALWQCSFILCEFGWYKLIRSKLICNRREKGLVACVLC
jgi:hypothetical protein